MVMGLERVTACVAPVIYIRYIRDRSIYLCAVTVLAVVPFFIVGIVLAVTNGTKGYVKFDCGRKATYSVSYAQSIYYWEMLGYFFGLLLNIIAYIKANSIIKSPTGRDQLRRIRYTLVVSALSTVLVSVPNVKSLFLDQLRFVGMDEWVSQMFNWASIINSSNNIFIYLWLHRDFRHEFVKIFRIHRFARASVVTVIDMPSKHTGSRLL